MAVWDKASFDKFYYSGAERWGRPNTRPQVKTHYNWFPILQWQAKTFAPKLVKVLGLLPGQSVFILGAGFNGMGAGLKRLGINVIGTDISEFIIAEKGNTEEAEIRAEIIKVGLDPDVDKVIGPPGNVMIRPLDLWLDGGHDAPKVREQSEVIEEDIASTVSRDRVNGRLPDKARYSISEEVLNGGTDAEALSVCELMAQYVSEKGGTVIHALSPLHPEKGMPEELNWRIYHDWRKFLNAAGFKTQLIMPTVTSTQQGMFMPDHETVRLRVFAESIARGLSKAAAEAKALAYADWHVSVNRVEAYSGVF